MLGYRNNPAMPYGAYELKATYQRNLMFGNLAALLIVTLALAVPYLTTALFGGTTVVIPLVPKPEPIEIIIINRQQPPIDKSEHAVKPTPSNPDQKMTDNLSVILDSLWGDDRKDEMLPTQGELSRAIGEGDTSGVSFIDTSDLNGSDYFPSDTEFVPTEKIPDFITFVKPDYPQIARLAGLEGTTVVKALVDKSGHVREAKIAKTSGYAVLDNAAVEAAFRNLYTPGIQNGYPVACWVSYRVEFKLND